MNTKTTWKLECYFGFIQNSSIRKDTNTHNWIRVIFICSTTKFVSLSTILINSQKIFNDNISFHKHSFKVSFYFTLSVSQRNTTRKRSKRRQTLTRISVVNFCILIIFCFLFQFFFFFFIIFYFSE